MEDKTELQKVIDRVHQMEAYMDEVAEMLKKSPELLKSDENLRKKVEILTGYMDSGQWRADYETDERGELPHDLKRGVLSEDGLYNLICDVELFFKEKKKRKWYERLFSGFRKKENY
jgi:hypothetical protein